MWLRKLEWLKSPCLLLIDAMENLFRCGCAVESFMTNESVDLIGSARSQWDASLRLVFDRVDGQTKLSERAHKGPLYVQKPFYPEGKEHPHVYILHPPGGIVSGDCLEVDIDVSKGASGLVTTPGATRFYRARENNGVQTQDTQIIVREGASLEWFPMETIIFNKANVRISTTIDLEEGGNFIGWEISCFGRPASSDLFTEGAFYQNYFLRINGQPQFVDHLSIEGGTESVLSDCSGFRGNTVSGFILIGPFLDSGEVFQESLRSAYEAIDLEESDLTAISKVSNFFVGRYLGNSADTAKKIFFSWWSVLRPFLLNRSPCAPRIWST